MAIKAICGAYIWRMQPISLAKNIKCWDEYKQKSYTMPHACRESSVPKLEINAEAQIMLQLTDYLPRELPSIRKLPGIPRRIHADSQAGLFETSECGSSGTYYLIHII